MEIKDWLAIFIPLLFNGIIFFGLQLIITRYIDKSMNYKNETLKRCLNLIQTTYELSLDFTSLNSTISGKDNIRFADVWNPFNVAVNKLHNFFKVHPNVISIEELELESFFSQVNYIRKLLYSDKVNNGNVISDDTDKELQHFLDLVTKDLENSNDLCEKRILKI